jgi:ATP-dependent Zn protease
MTAGGGPYRPRILPPLLTSILVVLGIFILVVFIVDKLVLAPGNTPSADVAIRHLERREVRRVSVPAHTVTLELKDGTTVTVDIPANRDLWPAVHASGADVSITSSGSDMQPLTYVFQFVPFVIMALLVIFILRTARRRT